MELRDGPSPVYPAATVYEPAAAPEDPWPAAIPLGEAEQVARFPVEVLPAWMQPIVIAVADDLQAEPDLPGMLGLVALSVAIAGSRHVHVRGPWREPLNIYIAIALPPSSGKSPAFKLMMAPIRAYEKLEMEASAGQVEHVAQTRRMIEKAMKRAEDKGDANEARFQLDKLLATPEAHPFRLIVDDATPEALILKLYEHEQRLAILSTEGGPFEMMGGRYTDSANLDPYLKPWSNDAISVDRVGRGTTILDHPVLTIGLTVQPSVIARLAENPAMITKGLTTRFMYSVPPTKTGYRDMHFEGNVPDEVRHEYGHRITALLAASRTGGGADLTIEPEALSEYNGWRQGLEAQRGPGAPLHVISEWTTKLESTVARVGGLLALADGDEVVTVATMRRALALGNYWLSHIKAVLDLWGQDDTLAKAREVLAWAQHRELSEFSVRELYGSLRRLFPTADETRPVLGLLTERGWIRPLFDGPLLLNRRGVESPRFAVRPPDLWISAVHARHARHVPKTDSEQHLLTLSVKERGTPRAHDAHGAHETETVQLPDTPLVDAPNVVDGGAVSVELDW
ncbi:MAG: YfjI family protein [Ilumatobacteraceae bacterium]